MLKFLLFLFLIISNQLFCQAWTFINKANQTIVLNSITESNLKEEREIFLKAFMKAYENISTQDLRVENKETFLNAAFDHEEQELNDKAKEVFIIRATMNEKVIGFICFNHIKDTDKIYIRQLAVDPEFWRSGIGKELVLSVLRKFPNTKSLVLVIRKLNKTGSNFYQALNFKPSTYMHEDYDDRYIGFEYTVNPA